MGDLWRYWLLGSALVETMLFSGCLLGWNSLSPVLRDLGVLSAGCHTGLQLSQTWSNDSAGVRPPTTGHNADPGSPSRTPLLFCIAQERSLNLGFSLGCLLLGGSFLPLQLVMATAHLRSLRQVGGALVSVSCLMLVYSCSNPQSLSLFLPAALVCLGAGGSCVLFTSLVLPLSLSSPPGSIYRFLVLGCFSASATVFTLIKVAHNTGVPFVPLILGFGALSSLMFLNSFFCWKLNRDEKGAEEAYSVQIRINCCERQQEKPQELEQWQQTLGHKFRESLRDRERILSLRKDLSFKKTGGQTPEAPPLRSSLLRPLFVLHLLSDSVLLAWLHFYISSLNLQLYSVAEHQRTADLYSALFGALQMIGLVSAPLLHLILSKRGSSREEYGGASPECRSRNPGAVRRLSLVFMLRILVVSGFGVCCLIPSLGLQVLGFILHVVGRSSVFLLSIELYYCVFSTSHFGALLGLYTLFTSLLTLLQHPLFLLLTSTLQGDPYSIHAAFLGLSLCATSVPLTLWIQCDRKHRPFTRPIALRRASASNKTDGLTTV